MIDALEAVASARGPIRQLLRKIEKESTVEGFVTQ
jgi:hypothetical protein